MTGIALITGANRVEHSERSGVRSPAAGATNLRLKPTKAMAKLPRARRQRLTATLEVRITTPGAPVRTLRRSVTLRPR